MHEYIYIYIYIMHLSTQNYAPDDLVSINRAILIHLTIENQKSTEPMA